MPNEEDEFGPQAKCEYRDRFDEVDANDEQITLRLYMVHRRLFKL